MGVIFEDKENEIKKLDEEVFCEDFLDTQIKKFLGVTLKTDTKADSIQNTFRTLGDPIEQVKHSFFTIIAFTITGLQECAEASFGVFKMRIKVQICNGPYHSRSRSRNQTLTEMLA